MADSQHPVLTSRQRAQRRSRITVGALAGFLVLALVIALAFAEGWLGGGTAQPAPTARTCPPPPPPPAKIALNIYNATDQDGLARDVAKGMSQQGFRIASVGNDPKAKKVAGVAELRFGPQGELAAKTVALRFPGASLVPDKRTDAVVDVAIGSTFHRLVVLAASVAPSTSPC